MLRRHSATTPSYAGRVSRPSASISTTEWLKAAVVTRWSRSVGWRLRERRIHPPEIRPKNAGHDVGRVAPRQHELDELPELFRGKTPALVRGDLGAGRIGPGIRRVRPPPPLPGGVNHVPFGGILL